MGIQHLSGLSQNIPVAGRQYFEYELAEEATWGSNHPCHVCFAGSEKGGFTSTPLKSAAKVGEDYSLLPQQKQARQSLLTSTEVHLDMTYKWLCANFASCASQRLTS